mmetsp:Transcript_48079/g.103602  ORF Transcript_48079/g.103602 Transcript_48079/m.103602 type:complete len:226 (+) Transcript_48079:873-1550(+)
MPLQWGGPGLLLSALAHRPFRGRGAALGRGGKVCPPVSSVCLVGLPMVNSLSTAAHDTYRDRSVRTVSRSSLSGSASYRGHANWTGNCCDTALDRDGARWLWLCFGRLLQAAFQYAGCVDRRIGADRFAPSAVQIFSPVRGSGDVRVLRPCPASKLLEGGGDGGSSAILGGSLLRCAPALAYRRRCGGFVRHSGSWLGKSQRGEHRLQKNRFEWTAHHRRKTKCK